MKQANSEPLNLPRQFLRMCRRNRKRTKVVDTSGLSLTGGELLTRTLVLRRLLLREVLAPDEHVVGLLVPPSVAGLIGNAACTLAGRVTVNLNYTLSADILNGSIAQAGLRHVLTSRRVLERFPELKLNVPLVFLEDLREKVTLLDKLLAAWAALVAPLGWIERRLGLLGHQDDDLFTIIFSSGSTGVPKGVMLSYENVRSNIEGVASVARLRNDDVFLGVLPYFHAFGFTCTVWGVLALDVGCAYHFNPLDAHAVGQLCRLARVTFMIATPTLLRTYLKRCSREDFPALEVVVCGAERLPVALADAFEAKFGVRPVEGYGATECSPLISVNVPANRALKGDESQRREGTVGRPLPGVSAKVESPSGGAITANGAGPLWIKGPNVMQGYLAQPERTAEVLRNDWYNTGDMATIDAEGFITLEGREARFSKIGGEMVPHVAIEDALNTALNADDDQPLLAVTAVPDAKRGERLVVLHLPIERTAGELSQNLLSAGLPRLWIPSPDSFFQVEALPLLATGKLDLKRLREKASKLSEA